jgi:hypothetical protein
VYYRWLVGSTLAHLGDAAAVADPLSDIAPASTSSTPADATASARPRGGAVACDDGEREAARAVVAAVLEREAGRLQADHLAAEPDAKWPLLTLARLREAQVMRFELRMLDCYVAWVSLGCLCGHGLSGEGRLRAGGRRVWPRRRGWGWLLGARTRRRS